MKDTTKTKILNITEKISFIVGFAGFILMACETEDLSMVWVNFAGAGMIGIAIATYKLIERKLNVKDRTIHYCTRRSR